MKRNNFLRIILTIIICNQTALGETMKDPTICGHVKCPETNNRKFKYLERVHYRYKYHVDVSLQIGNTFLNQNESHLFIDADLKLLFTSPCEGTLQLSNVSISHDQRSYQSDFPDRAGAEFKNSLENQYLRFTFHDGIIKEICPLQSEEIWALNFKRGVLSMLQNSMIRFDVDRRLDELDVNGICDTKYRLQEAHRTSLIIRKSKDLSSCQHSSKHLSLVQSQMYRSLNPQLKNFQRPFVSSENSCEMTIDHNIYKKIECYNSYQHKTISKKKNDETQIKVLCLLELKTEVDESEYISDYSDKQTSFIHSKKTTLLFDHTKSVRTIYGELRISRNLLKVMCFLSTNTDLNNDFSETFSKFVHSVKMLDNQGLSQLYYRAQSICKAGRNFILNALPYIGTNAAVNLMKELIIKKKVVYDETKFWITSFSFLARPDRHIMYTLATILEYQANIRDSQFLLSFSSVIHAFCNSYGFQCIKFEPVKSFIKFVEKNLRISCSSRIQNKEETVQILEVLKAVGNAGIASEILVIQLKKCFEDVNNYIPVHIRVAAIDAHRRFSSCEKFRNLYFMNIYRNHTAVTELRIASYLQIMRCPDYNVIKIIRQILETEEVNQVGTFVWSHLKNLLSSSSPTQIEIQSLLTDHKIGNKFNKDFRKFSRNYANSFYSEEYNFGLEYQTNLIFSPKSYIPRTLSSNFTVDLFGESINFFELSFCFEGLEFYSEMFFGPKGSLSKTKVANYFHNVLRILRSVNSEENEDNLWKKIKTLPNVIDNNFFNPEIISSIKIFGNEIKFLVLHSDQDIRSFLNSLNPWEKVKKLLSGQGTVSFENNAMVLDFSYILPTLAGLPLQIDLSGSIAYNIKLSGILKSEKFMSNGELEINGSMVPSVSIDTTGTVSVDAFYKSIGVKMKTTIFSSTALEVDLNIQSLNSIKLSWKLPNRRTEIFSLSNDVLIMTENGAERREQPISIVTYKQPSNKTEDIKTPLKITRNPVCSGYFIDKLIGLNFCVDYHFSNSNANFSSSYLILNGLSRLNLYIIKADPTAEIYIIEYRWEKTKTKNIINFVFCTPGSKIRREMNAMVSFDLPKNNVTMLLKSKVFSFIAKGFYKRMDNETYINVLLDSPGFQNLDANIGYNVKKTKYSSIFFPKIFLKINSEKIISLSGTIKDQDKTNSSQFDIDIQFESKNFSSSIIGYIILTNTSLSGNIKNEYKVHNRSKAELLQTEFSLINQSTQTLTYKAADVKFYSSAYPPFNVIAGLKYQLAAGHVEIQLEINTRPHFHDGDQHKLVTKFIVTYSKPFFQIDGSNISTYIAITKPAQAIDFRVGMNHYSVESETKTRFLARFAPEKELSLVIAILKPRSAYFFFQGEANLTIPSFSSFYVHAKIKERLRNEYEINFLGTGFDGFNISATGTYYDRSTVIILNHLLNINFVLPYFNNKVIFSLDLFFDITSSRIGVFLERSNAERYILNLKHTILRSRHYLTFFESKYKNSSYSILSNIEMHQKAIVYLHLDRWRDMLFAITGINEKIRKYYGVEVKWDAIRNPNLKISMSLKYDNEISFLRGKNLDATVSIFYPGRHITASLFYFFNSWKNSALNTSIMWEKDRGISLTINTDFNALTRNFKINSLVITPIENWTKILLKIKHKQEISGLLTSGCIHWHHSEFIHFNISEIAETLDSYSSIKINSDILSSIKAISHVEVSATYKFTSDKRLDCQIMIKYDEGKTLEAITTWLIINNKSILNITGNFKMNSIINYYKTSLVCYLTFNSNWKFHGVTHLDLKKKIYAVNIFGDMTNFKESLLQFNVTTPSEKYLLIRGDFAYSEKKKRIIAKVFTATCQLGFEGIFQLNSEMKSFNIKFSVATPIDVFQKASLTAKLNEQDADFQISYNNATVGFQGTRFYRNIFSFNYGLTVFIPMEGVNEIGVILKLIALKNELSFDDIDTEMSIWIAELKVGLKAYTVTDAVLPPLTSFNLHDLLPKNISFQDRIYCDGDAETDFHWHGKMMLDIGFLQTIIGSLELNQKGNTDNIFGYLKLPYGDVIVEDNFYMEDLLRIKNDLSIDLPFVWSSEIILSSYFAFDLDKSLTTIDTVLNIESYSEWTRCNFAMNYQIQEKEEGLQLHWFKLNLKSPIRFAKIIRLETVSEVEKNILKTNVSVQLLNTSLEFIGSLRHGLNYLEAYSAINLSSSLIHISTVKIFLKKDLTQKKENLKFTLDIKQKNVSLSEIDVLWSDKIINGTIALNSWLRPVIKLKTIFFFNNNLENDFRIDSYIYLKNLYFKNYWLISKLGDKNFSLNLIKNNKCLFILKGNVIKKNRNINFISGKLSHLKASKTFVIRGFATYEKNYFRSLKFFIIPVIELREVNSQILKFKLQTENYGLKFEGSNEEMKGNAEINYLNCLNWDLDFELSNKKSEKYGLLFYVNAQVNRNTTIYLELKKLKHQLEKLILECHLVPTGSTGTLNFKYGFNEDVNDLLSSWRFFHGSDIFVDAFFKKNWIKKIDLHFHFNIFFIHKNFKNMNSGLKIFINNLKWLAELKLAMEEDYNNSFHMFSHVRFLETEDTYAFNLSCRTEKIRKELVYIVGYTNELSKLNHLSDGLIKVAKDNINGYLRLEWEHEKNSTLKNIFNITNIDMGTILEYSISSPKFSDENRILLFFLHIKNQNSLSLFSAKLLYPGHKQLAFANMLYYNLTNFNCTIEAPRLFTNIPKAKCDFIFSTRLNQAVRFLQVNWKNNSALVKSNYIYEYKPIGSSVCGYFIIKFPMNSRHVCTLNYGHNKEIYVANGYLQLVYNKIIVLKSEYKSREEFETRFEKKHVNITIENFLKPIGISYMHMNEFGSDEYHSKYPITKFTKINFHQLLNDSAFNLTGMSTVRSTLTGKKIEFKAVHLNRTITLQTVYDVSSKEFRQFSKLSLANDTWISYDIQVITELFENEINRSIFLKLDYPQRNFTLKTLYLNARSKFISKAVLSWKSQSEKERTAGICFDWINISSTNHLANHSAAITFLHPTFNNSVQFIGELAHNNVHDVLNILFTIKYSEIKDEQFSSSFIIFYENEFDERIIKYDILIKHPKTQLTLDMKGQLSKIKFQKFEVNGFTKYKRSFLPGETYQIYGNIDIEKSQIKYNRKSNDFIKCFETRYYSIPPKYILNGSLVDGYKKHSTGTFFINSNKKLTWMVVNFTPDSTESLRMYGKIPDVRNAEFSIWRINDQDIAFLDVAFYIRLNHSRLITSKLKWKPDLKSEVFSTIKKFIVLTYEDLGKNIDYWKHYIRSEMINILTDVWIDAQDELEVFLEDLQNLKNVKKDFEDLKSYLNNSYKANEFFIQDVVTLYVYIIDELSLSNHIQSLPNILNEIWEIMGDSGEAFRKSLSWIIATIKSLYHKFSEVFQAIFKGESLDQISEIFEELILRYDIIIKELHVSFIKYIEYLYAKILKMIYLQWHRFLIQVEPIFIHFAHYLETVAWKAIHEFFNFLYDRKLELITSPYYDQFANFTHDIDKFYRDIKNNDIVTNVENYSCALVIFIKERYFMLVPYGNELKDIIDKVVSEIQNLQKLPLVKYMIEKFRQIYNKMSYLYRYFEIKQRLESAVRFIREKLIDISQTALQAASKYRQAKTKFIFDPNHGLMFLEQKLPISWHAFNQTPEFQEIPEYRAIADLSFYFTQSNTTFWTIYYQIKPFIEPENWLPPFKAYSMIIRAQNFRTFDGFHYKFSGNCTYLLICDFVENDFAVLIRYLNNSRNILSHQIIVLAGVHSVQFDMSQSDHELMKPSREFQLPVELNNGSVFVYQEENLIIVENEQKTLRIECNLKFNVCGFELSGWLYGKTAGLLGTINNEKMDDTLSSNGKIEKNVGSFAQSWSLNIENDPSPCSADYSFSENSQFFNQIFCDDLFLNKSSQFNLCFGIIDPKDFYNMCLNSANAQELCSCAVSYLQICAIHDTFLRIPDNCTSCSMDDLIISDGDFQKLENEKIPKSTDIVFIIEAKKCNQNIRKNLNIDLLTTFLQKELKDNGLIDNRWALVTFGGNGVYDKPRNLILDNQIFTRNLSHFAKYFDQIKIGDGNRDIFEAIRFSTRLVFRAGVSKTFILFPCSDCELEKQTLDYSVLYHTLQEHGIKLHILINGDFKFKKARFSKIFYGLDASRAYTKTHFHSVEGDIELRRLVKRSKSLLGFCTPLSLETNGTIFSAMKLQSTEKINSIKRFISIFTKRVVLTAHPSSCQLCECIANNNGLAKLECTPCNYPIPVIANFSGETFSEDNLTTLVSEDFDWTDEAELVETEDK